MSKPEIHLPEGMTTDEAKRVIQEYHDTEDPEIINQEMVSALREEITEAKEAFAAALAEESPQSADTLARQDMAALTEPITGGGGAVNVDTLRQVSETKNPDSFDDVGGSSRFDPDALSLSAREKITEVLAPKRQSFKNRGIEGRVEELEDEIATLAGVDDYEDVDLEAL